MNSSFKDWLYKEMAQINFGAHANKSHEQLPRHYAQWMADQIKSGNGNFNVTDKGKKLTPNEILAALQKSHGIAGNSSVPQVPQTQVAQQKSAAIMPGEWIHAKSIAVKPEYEMPAANLNLAMRKYDENKWIFVILDPEEGRLVSRGFIPTLDLKNVVKSEKNTQGQPTTGKKPSDILKAITPKKTSKGNTIPDNHITDEQQAIDAKFAEMLQEPGPSHLVLNALAGTGKTSVLKHLAWKYSKGKRWLYLVFNSKNKEEAKGEFPPNVAVDTTNGWAGREVLGKNHVKPTDRIQDYSRSEKAKMIADSSDFKKLTQSLNIPDPIATYGREPKVLGRVEKSLWFLLRSMNMEFKSEAVKLLGLAKAFAIDPRNQEELDNELQKVMDQYDLNTHLENIKEKIQKNSPWAANEISNLMGKDFLSRDFTEELKSAALWLLQQTMPHASKEKFTADRGNQEGVEHELGTKRDFDDDLWFSAIHANELKWPKYDVVLADEVQDFNAAQKLILQKLAENGAKIVAVGDKNQCVIEGTQILIGNKSVSVETLKEGDSIIAACGNSKIVSSKINKIFNRFVTNKELIKITTKNGFSLTTTPDHTHFAGYVCDEQQLYFTYLMYREDLGYRIGVTKKKKKISTRLNQERGDKLWLIDVFDSDVEARLYEQFYSIKYGLPTWVFNADARKDTLSYDNKTVERLFKMTDTEKGAFQLLNDKQMFLEHPHIIPKCMNRKRYRNFNIVMCGDNRRMSLHKYSIAGSNENDCLLLKDLNLKVRTAKRGWRIESSHSKLKEVYSILEKIQSNMQINVIEKARFTNTTLPFMPASHVLRGMSIFVQENEKIILDEVVSVEKIKYSGKIYDLNVDRYHNFIANNIVTHNSIYRFRGATNNAMGSISDMLQQHSQNKDIQRPLTKNFRSRQAVIDMSNQEGDESGHVSNLVKGKPFKEEPGRIGQGQATKDEKSYDDAFDTLKQEMKDMGEVKQTAFLARTNEPLVHASLKLLKQGTPFIILGKDIANDLNKHIDKIMDIYGRDVRPDSPVEDLERSITSHNSDNQDEHAGKAALAGRMKELAEISDALVSAIGQFTEENSEGTVVDFRRWLHAKFGGLAIDKGGREGEKAREEFKKQIEELNPVILSTVHKSKGLQFQRVYILRDDLWPHPRAKRPEDFEEEMNNKYIGRTRAEDELHVLKLKDQPGYKDTSAANPH